MNRYECVDIRYGGAINEIMVGHNPRKAPLMVRVDQDLLASVRGLAVISGASMQELVEEALREHLCRNSGVYPVIPRTRGLRAGRKTRSKYAPKEFVVVLEEEGDDANITEVVAEA